MNTLETAIAHFDNWAQPWTFYDSIDNNATLNEADRLLFNNIWIKAGNGELWNDADLVQCCKAAQIFIMENFNMSDTSVAFIVRAISYQWK